MERPEIRASNFPHDMGGWCAEKSGHVVHALAHLVDTVRASRALSSSERETVEFEIYDALWNATKLLSFSSGGVWSTGDSDLVMERGTQGYEELLVRYGVITETTEARHARESQETTERHRQERLALVSAMRECLELPRHEGRQRMHDLLTRCPGRTRAYEHLADLTERVTMGELEWDDYVPEARSAIDAMDAQQPRA